MCCRACGANWLPVFDATDAGGWHGGGTSSGGSGVAAPAAKPDSAGDVKALEEANAILTKDAGGNVIAVELDHESGNDEQVVLLKGLPNVVTLDAGSRGVTDKAPGQA